MMENQEHDRVIAARVERYEYAVNQLQEYVRVNSDGTLEMTIDVGTAMEMRVDPAVFFDLKRSLDETNSKITKKEINATEVAANLRRLS